MKAEGGSMPFEGLRVKRRKAEIRRSLVGEEGNVWMRLSGCSIMGPNVLPVPQPRDRTDLGNRPTKPDAFYLLKSVCPVAMKR